MIGKKWVLTDYLAQSHSQHLKASLYSFFNVQKPIGNTLPNGYHLIYFNPKHEEEALSKDGYDAHQQPNDDKFKRRLWVGGEIEFIKPVHFNQRAFCVEEIERVRKIKDTSMVSINREIITNDQVAIIEKRVLLYTNDLYNPEDVRPKLNTAVPQYKHILRPTDLLNFRYSALTFNAHRIHWDKEYVSKEGYPNLLVQGPLTITLLLEWVSTLFNDINIKSFKYKNQSPIFVNDVIQLSLNQENETEYSLWIEGKDKQIHVSGKLTVDSS